MGRNPKGWKVTSVLYDDPGTIGRAERNIRARTAARQLAADNGIMNTSCIKLQKTLDIIGYNGKRIRYTKVDKIPSFSVQELLQSVGIEGIDMSSDLDPAIEVKTMLSRLAEHVNEEHPKIRIYMRDLVNYENFAMLQHLVETTELVAKPLKELQGYILHSGPVVVTCAAMDSVDKCKEAICSLAHHTLSESGLLDSWSIFDTFSDDQFRQHVACINFDGSLLSHS